MSKSSSVDVALEELDLVVSLSKEYFPEGVPVNISERSLSQYGIYHTLVTNDEVILKKTTYGHEEVLKIFDSRRKFLECLQEDLWDDDD